MADQLDDVTDLLASYSSDTILAEIERADCEESLYTFFQHAWPYIDPAPFTDGQALQAVAEHLEAVVNRDIRNLIINIPPRMSKSSLVSVCFPAWVWARRSRSILSGPGTQFLHASYALSLALRDSVKCRRLIKSPWYQHLWGDRFSLMADQDAKTRFDNSAGGYRMCTSVDAAVTGEGGHIIGIDDPNSAREALSEATIEATIEWWDTTMSSRLNDPKTGAFLIIQQRVAENDLTGHILSKDVGDWTHLMLPMRYEPERSFHTPIGWKDWRTLPGELLWPERFGEAETKILEGTLGTYGTAGQLQQRPEVKGGGIIKRENWKLWDTEKHKVYPPFSYMLMCCDTAYTARQENDPSACTVWGVFNDENGVTRAMLVYAWAEHLEFNELIKKIKQTAKRFKVDMVRVESKASGISVIQELRRESQDENWSIHHDNPGAQDKVARAYAVQPSFEDGLIFAPDTTWAETVITQCAVFPKGKHDDLVDTVTQAIGYLRKVSILKTGGQRTFETTEELTYHSPSDFEPIYPV